MRSLFLVSLSHFYDQGAPSSSRLESHVLNLALDFLSTDWPNTDMQSPLLLQSGEEGLSVGEMPTSGARGAQPC